MLNNLAEYVNTQELPNKRVQQINARFTSLERFKEFKEEVAADEERKLAQQDMVKQLKQVFVKMQDFDAAQLNLENDLGKLDHEVRQKASNEKVEEIEDHMETLATKLDIDRVFNKLEAYTTLEKFNKMKIQ